jgi:hypothetical protein
LPDRDQVTEIITTLVAKLRNHSVADQVFVIEEMLNGLGWSGPALHAINRIVKGMWRHAAPNG